MTHYTDATTLVNETELAELESYQRQSQAIATAGAARFSELLADGGLYDDEILPKYENEVLPELERQYNEVRTAYEEACQSIRERAMKRLGLQAPSYDRNGYYPKVAALLPLQPSQIAALHRIAALSGDSDTANAAKCALFVHETAAESKPWLALNAKVKSPTAHLGDEQFSLAVRDFARLEETLRRREPVRPSRAKGNELFERRIAERSTRAEHDEAFRKARAIRKLRDEAERTERQLNTILRAKEDARRVIGH